MVLEKELDKETFSTIFILASPALMLGITDLLYNHPRLRQNAGHISCWVEFIKNLKRAEVLITGC